MCRYAMIKYKPHYACFKCRKTFKRKLLSDITGKDASYANEAKCPDCGSLMANMGKDFEAPKKGSLKEWAHIERLYSVGITFHSCGCSGPGYIPNTADKLIAYLEGVKDDYNHNLAFWRQREEPTNKSEVDRDKSLNWKYISQVPTAIRPKKGAVGKEDPINYWIKRITEVEQKLAIIK